MVDTRDLATMLSAFWETLRVELLKFGETLTGEADGNPERSPQVAVIYSRYACNSYGERVETRRAAPTAQARVKG